MGVKKFRDLSPRCKCNSGTQVQITIKLTAVVGVENLQVKLVSQSAGFNQIDKRWVTSYFEMWNIRANVTELLQRFTRELAPIGPTRDPRRTFADEFSPSEQTALLTFLIDHQTLIVSDTLKGRGKFSAEWLLGLA